MAPRPEDPADSVGSRVRALPRSSYLNVGSPFEVPQIVRHPKPQPLVNIGLWGSNLQGLETSSLRFRVEIVPREPNTP